MPAGVDAGVGGGVGVDAGGEYVASETEESCGTTELPQPDSIAAVERTARPIAAGRSSDERETSRVDGTVVMASTVVPVPLWRARARHDSPALSAILRRPLGR
jgi:hypothetical protein